MAIQKITADTVKKILMKTANALPNRPSERGITAEQLKKYFFEFVTSDKNSIKAEIDRIVEEVNQELATGKSYTDDSIVKRVLEYNPVIEIVENSEEESIECRHISGKNHKITVGKPLEPYNITSEDAVVENEEGTISEVIVEVHSAKYYKDADGSEHSIAISFEEIEETHSSDKATLESKIVENTQNIQKINKKSIKLVSTTDTSLFDKCFAFTGTLVFPTRYGDYDYYLEAYTSVNSSEESSRISDSTASNAPIRFEITGGADGIAVITYTNLTDYGTTVISGENERYERIAYFITGTYNFKTNTFTSLEIKAPYEIKDFYIKNIGSQKYHNLLDYCYANASVIDAVGYYYDFVEEE